MTLAGIRTGKSVLLLGFMSAVISIERVCTPPSAGREQPPIPAPVSPELRVAASTLAGPSGFVRWAFYLSVFAIPFARFYIPGTGERLGVIRIEQLLLLCAALSQPRVCLGRVPVALLWIGAYCGLRILSGLWFSPELWASWWPTTLGWLQFSLPWVWVMFNLVQFPGVARQGLWALVWGCVLCASFHIAGVGVTVVEDGMEGIRSTVFGENPNVVGATYAAGLIALIGLGMFKNIQLSRRWLLLPMIALVGMAMAKTGSRAPFFIVGIGILVLLLQAQSFSSRTRRYTTLILIGAVFAVILCMVPTVMNRFQDIDPHNIGHHNPRARMDPVLWDIFLRSPTYGTGPDQYCIELTRRALPYLIAKRQAIGAHNLALMLLVETGIIGFVVFQTGQCKALAAAWRARLRPCGLLPLALLLPFFVAGFVMANPLSDQVFWLALAYSLAGAA